MSKKHGKKSALRILLPVAGSLILVGLIVLGVYLGRVGKLSEQILDGEATEIITGDKKLKTDAKGRVNIVILGNAEDDPAHINEILAMDTILVLSVQAETGQVTMFSIPRDLWVKQACLGSGKINGVYACEIEHGDAAALDAMRESVTEVTGIEIPYYIKVNFSAISALVDLVGGVDVEIYTDDARGIYDERLDFKLPAGTNHLDGEAALKLARVRNSKGGYGLSRSNFDREINQQRIIQAVFAKIKSQKILKNPLQAFELLEILGDNMRSNISTAEAKDAYGLFRKIKLKNINSLSLIDAGLVKADKYAGQDIVRPTAGLGDFSGVQEYLAENL